MSADFWMGNEVFMRPLWKPIKAKICGDANYLKEV